MSDEELSMNGAGAGDRGAEETPREELAVELPMDWDKLKAEVLRRDEGKCMICGSDAEERQLYVLYARPPSRLSRVPPSASDGSESLGKDGNEGVTEVEVPGYGVENMVTVCEIHAVGGRKDRRTVVVPDEVRAARKAAVGGRSEEGSGFARNAHVTDRMAGDEVGFPEHDGAGADGGGDGIGSRFGMADEFSSAMDAVSGSDSASDEHESMVAGGDVSSDLEEEHERDGAAELWSSDGGLGGVSSEGNSGGAGLTRSFGQRRFGLHLPFVGRTLRMVRAVVWVAASVTVLGGIVAGVVGGSAEAGAAAALDIGSALVGIGAMAVSSPWLVFGLFALVYGVHLRYRDGPYSAWPMIRESPSPQVGGRRLVVIAGVTGVLGVAVSALGELWSLGALAGGSTSVSVTEAAMAVIYVVGIGLTTKVMGDTVVADRKAGSAVRAFAWEFPVRVGGILAAIVVLTGIFVPTALIALSIPMIPVGLLVVASVLVAPVSAVAYALRRRVVPTVRGVPVEMDPDAPV